MTLDERNAEVLALRESGATLQDIADRFGISKERVRQLTDPDANRDHEVARQMVRQAVQSGKLTRLPCQVCGEPDTQAHHEDYNKPLEIIWLCKKHHGELHRAINQSTQLPKPPKVQEDPNDPTIAELRHAAAVALGKLGGNANTEAQRAARSANARKGGRPKGSKNRPKIRKAE